MEELNAEALRSDLEQFRKEREKVRAIIEGIGGRSSMKREKIANVFFAIAIIALFLSDVLRHWANVSIPIPPIFSIQLGVLLVSIKIIWMIHLHGKVEHFQFWILNSIEFRLNDVLKRLQTIEGLIK